MEEEIGDERTPARFTGGLISWLRREAYHLCHMRGHFGQQRKVQGEIMRMTVVAALMCALLVAVPLCAQSDQAPPELVLKEVLRLDDSQVAAIQQLAQARQQAIEPLAKQIGARQQALYAALEAPGADPADVGKLAIAIRDLQ